MMRRSSGSTVREATHQVIQAQVGPDNVVWWESRLIPYRHIVLFLWNSLTFSPSFLPGAAVWGLVNVLIWSLFHLSGSVLEIIGNLLVISTILYALSHVGLKYGKMTLFPDWNGNSDVRFHQICGLISNHFSLVSSGVSAAMETRNSAPKMFYGVGFLASFIIYHLGEWISTVYLVQLTVCLVLLLPLIMEHGQSNPEQFKDKLQRIWLELKELVKAVVFNLSQAIQRLQTRTRQRGRATNS